MNIIPFIMGVAATYCLINIKNIWTEHSVKKELRLTIVEFFITLMVLSRGLKVPYEEIITNFNDFIDDFMIALKEVKKYE